MPAVLTLTQRQYPAPPTDFEATPEVEICGPCTGTFRSVGYLTVERADGQVLSAATRLKGDREDTKMLPLGAHAS